jgi:polyferredoxin
MAWLWPPIVQALVGTGSWTQAWNSTTYFLGGLAVFVGLVILLGKSWCGWLCPFGVVQDWLSRIRRLFKIRESEILLNNKQRISMLKYVLLFYLLFLPSLSGFGLLPRDFVLAFCNICVAKLIMPMVTGDLNHWILGASGGARYIYAVILLLLTGSMSIGMFFKDRFFCLFCPMLAIIDLLRPFHILRLAKDPSACRGCGNCRRNCSMDNQTIYLERVKKRVYDPDCLGCFTCSEGCASDDSLSVRFGPLTLFSSSRRYSSRNLTGGGL